MKNWRAFLYFFIIPCFLQAQISAGDIAVIGINGVANNKAEVTVVTLVDIAANSTIYVTDVPYDGGLSAVTTNDGIITWTTPSSTLSAGTVVTFDLLFNATGTPTVNINPSTGVGSISVSGWTNTLTLLAPFGNGSGDNIFIYTGSASSPSFIYGFINSSVNGQANGGGPGEWFTTLLTSSSRSALPPSLLNSNGSNVATAHALNGSQHADSYYYTGTRSGTRDEILIEIGKDHNWNGSSSVQDITPGGSIFSGTNPVFTIGSACSMTASITSTSNISCSGAGNGSVTVTQSNGTANFTFSWSNGTTNSGVSSSSNTLSGLAAGTFTVTVTDANGCTATASSSIIEPTAVGASASVSSTILCNGGTGNVTVTPSGGTGSYTYNWNTGSTSQTVTGLTANTYSVTVTDGNGCTDSSSISLTANTAVGASASVSSAILCNGGIGNVTVTPSGGTGSYTYNWNTGATSQTVTGLTANTYSVTVTDGNGCTDSSSVSLIANTAVGASASISSAILCNGGTGNVTVTPSGGTGSYTYNWNTGSTSQTVTGLTANTYSVTVTDGNGCTDSSSVSLTANTAVGASASVSSAILCNGGTGAVTATPSGGTGSYTYNWNTGSTSQTVTGLAANTYSVTVTDGNGCTDSSSISLTEPAAVAASVTLDSNATCSGFADGGATVMGSGGTPGYTYSWNNSATTASITGVLAGTYSVTITDANSCTDNSSVTISDGASVVVSATPVDASCPGNNDGAASINVSGGTPSYSYLWNTGAVTQNISAVSAGTYTVTVTDANGCQTQETTSVGQPGILTGGGIISTN